MFKNYYGTTKTQEQQLVYVQSGYQLILLSIDIYGGQHQGVLTLTKYDNTSGKKIAFQQQITVQQFQHIVLSHKIILPTNFSYSFKGNVNGIYVCLNAVLQQTDEESQQSNNGPFSLTKVTKYVPYRAQFTAPTSITVSGFGWIGYDQNWGMDASKYNGTYQITDETRYKTGFSRVYKSTSGNYYLIGYQTPQNEWSQYPTGWYFQTSSGSPDLWGGVYYTAQQIPSGTNTWKTYDYGSASVTTEVINTTYQQQQQICVGKTAVNYSGIYSYSNDNIYYTQFDKQPKVGQLFISKGDVLLGNIIDYRGYFEDEVTSSTVAYLPLYTIPKAGDKDQSQNQNTVSINYDNFRVDKGPLRNSIFTYPSGFTPGGIVLSLTSQFNLNNPWTAEIYATFVRGDAPYLLQLGAVTLYSDGSIKAIVNGNYPNNRPSPAYDSSTWHHIAIVHTNSTITLYFDGVAYYDNEPFDTSNINLGTISSINIATNGESYYNFVGNISEFMFSNYAKYYQNFTPIFEQFEDDLQETNSSQSSDVSQNSTNTQ